MLTFITVMKRNALLTCYTTSIQKQAISHNHRFCSQVLNILQYFTLFYILHTCMHLLDAFIIMLADKPEYKDIKT